MCNEQNAQFDPRVGGASVSGAAQANSDKSREYDKHMAMRNAMVRTPGATFEVRMQVGQIVAVQRISGLAELIDTLCTPRQYSLSVSVILPTNR